MTTEQQGNGLSADDIRSQRRLFHPLRVAKVIDETHDSKSIVFEIPPHLKRVYEYSAGQFLTFEIPYNGVTLKRCYSLASSPQTDSEHKVTVKRVTDGRISNWLNDHLKAGDTLSVLPPDGRFVLHDLDTPLVLFAGGSGITPIISLLKSALTVGASKSKPIKLVYANRDEPSIIFKKELESLVQARPGRLEIVHRLDSVQGFLKPSDVMNLVGSIGIQAFICGPGPFMDAVERGLIDAGVKSEKIHIEKFVSPSDPKPAPTKEAVTETQTDSALELIHVEHRGQQYKIPCKPGKTILQMVRDAGVDAPYSCEEGFCGCCIAKLDSGKVEMTADDALSDDEKKRGFILTCQSHVTAGPCSVKYIDD